MTEEEPYLLGSDNAYHRAERAEEAERLRALAERLGLRITLDLAAMVQPSAGPTSRLRAKARVLEAQNDSLRREAFDAVTYRERELLALQERLHRLEREGRDVATLAKAVRAQTPPEQPPAPEPRQARQTPAQASLKAALAIMDRDPPDVQGVIDEEREIEGNEPPPRLRLGQDALDILGRRQGRGSGS